MHKHIAQAQSVFGAIILYRIGRMVSFGIQNGSSIETKNIFESFTIWRMDPSIGVNANTEMGNIGKSNRV